MRLRFALLCLIFSLAAVLGSVAANASPFDKPIDLPQFKKDCILAGGTVKSAKVGVYTCALPGGNARTCNLNGDPPACSSEQAALRP